MCLWCHFKTWFCPQRNLVKWYPFCTLYCCIQASEGVPIRFFMTLSELVDAYFSPNMGLITNLQHSVQREEEAEEEQGQTLLSVQTGATLAQTDVIKNVFLCFSRMPRSSTTASTQNLHSRWCQRTRPQVFWDVVQISLRHVPDETAAYGHVHVIHTHKHVIGD